LLTLRRGFVWTLWTNKCNL